MHDLIDIGANLTHDSFDQDRDTLIERAELRGVRRMMVTGASVDGSHAAVELARARPRFLYATTGVHPHHADDFDANAEQTIRKLAADEAVVAVGECGLDYFRNFSTPAAQLRAFEAQLRIAVELKKPVFLHQRDAHEPFLSLLDRFVADLPGGVAHCFTGDLEQMQAYLDRGLCIGITGWICDERRGQALREAVAELPLDRVMLETDAPYLLPRDLPEKPSGRRNEPAFLPHVLAAAAHYMGRPAADVARAATANTERVFLSS